MKRRLTPAMHTVSDVALKTPLSTCFNARRIVHNSLLALVLLIPVLPLASIAAVRCTDAAGAVAYVDNALACPAGFKATGEVAAMPPVNIKDQAHAKAQASRDQHSIDALDKQRQKEHQAQLRAVSKTQQKDARKTKSCKNAELALKRAKSKYDDMPSAASKTGRTGGHASSKATDKANGKDSKTQTHTAIREGDGKASKAQKKARDALVHAQAKRDLVCE